MGLGIGQREGVILEANLGRLIVTNGDLQRTCSKAREPPELRFGMLRGVDRAIAVLHGCPRRAKERGREVVPIFTMGFSIVSPMVKCFRFVCDNLIRFPFGKHIVGRIYSCAFRGYIHFYDQSCDLREIRKKI